MNIEGRLRCYHVVIALLELLLAGVITGLGLCWLFFGSGWLSVVTGCLMLFVGGFMLPMSASLFGGGKNT